MLFFSTGGDCLPMAAFHLLEGAVLTPDYSLKLVVYALKPGFLTETSLVTRTSSCRGGRTWRPNLFPPLLTKESEDSWGAFESAQVDSCQPEITSYLTSLLLNRDASDQAVCPELGLSCAESVI